MKKTLLALALFAFAGTSAFAHDGHDKDGKKGKKATCSTEAKASCSKDMKGSMAGGHSCCMKGGKTAAAPAATKSEVAVKQ